MKSRQIKYDWLRTIAAFGIILVHAIPPTTTTHFQWWFHSTSTPLLLSFVGIYFMLSGVLILRPFSGSIWTFYKKRIIAIGIPLLFYSMIYALYDQLTKAAPLPPSQFLILFCKNFINGSTPYAGHLWFMYTLVGLYLCAPFFSRLLQALSDQDLKNFIWIMIIAQGAITYGSMAGFYLPVPVFTGWTLYFLLGYSLKRLYSKEYYPFFLALGLLSLLITLIQKRFFPAYTTNIHDLAPTMIFIAAAVFLFFEFFGETKIPAINSIVTWISQYSYSIYLIHFLILQNFVKPRIYASRFAGLYLLNTGLSALLTFILALIISIIFDHTVIRAAKWLALGTSNKTDFESLKAKQEKSQ